MSHGATPLAESEHPIWAVPHVGDLRFVRGPADAGPRGPEVEHLATTPLERYYQALAEGVVSALQEGTAAEIVESVNGAAGNQRRLTEDEILRHKARLEELDTTISQVEAAMASVESDPDTVNLLKRRIRDLCREAEGLTRQLQQNQRSTLSPESHHPVEVAGLLAGLGGLVRGEYDAGQALDDILVDWQVTRIDLLAVHFQASVAIPDRNGKVVLSDPFHFSTENTRRLSGEKRSRAMAKLCLQNGWPATVVAEGIPYRCAAMARQRVTAKLSAALRPHLGRKIPQIVAAAEVPEVMGTVASALGLGEPEVPLQEPLRRRIERLYVRKELPKWFNISWELPANRERPLAALVQRVHAEGRVLIDEVLSEGELKVTDLERWLTARYLTVDGDHLTRVMCRCGSSDLALIATPEPDGLVCLSCREDRSGVAIPESWNRAVSDPDYWSELGHNLQVPATPGIQPTHLPAEPLRLRGSNAA